MELLAVASDVPVSFGADIYFASCIATQTASANVNPYQNHDDCSSFLIVPDTLAQEFTQENKAFSPNCAGCATRHPHGRTSDLHKDMRERWLH